jgi:DNA-binding transcriptional ArsR family regulator
MPSTSPDGWSTSRGPRRTSQPSALADGLLEAGDVQRASHQGGEACICDLTGVFELSQPTISHPMKVLHEAGLVHRDKRGVWVYYRIRPRALASQGTLIGCPPLARNAAATAALTGA